MARTLANRPRPRHPVVTLAIQLHILTQDAVEMAADALLACPLCRRFPPSAHASGHASPPPRRTRWMEAKGTCRCLNCDVPSRPCPAGTSTPPRRRHQRCPEEPGRGNPSRPPGPPQRGLAVRGPISQWRTATVVPVLKPGKPADQLNSHRPIELTSALPDRYAGFRRRRCTADAIADLATTFEDGKARRRTTGVVYLDIASAFERVLHGAIVDVDSLTRLGVRGRALRYVRAFLQGREARFRASGLYSAPRTLTRGVLQGSVLSPLLFSLALTPSLSSAGRATVQAVRDVLRGARTTTNILRLLGGARRGTEQRMMLQLYCGLTLARVLYALLLLALAEHQWGRIECASVP
ncbi:hypothetical protein ISCGN_009165 [Ixodes scapularis]